MRDDYKILGPTSKLSIDIETDVAKRLDEMSRYTELSVSEMVNTAVKRFIATHKDFLPPGHGHGG